MKKEILTDFLDFPFLLSEQLWKIVEPKAKGFITCEEFADFFGKLAYGSIRDKISLIFQMYYAIIRLDLDNDGFLSKDDTVAILLQIPFSQSKPIGFSSSSTNFFKSRNE